MAINPTTTHTLRLRADASQAKAGLDQIDKELKDVVRELDRARAAAGSFQKATAGTGKQISAAANSTRMLAQQKSILAKQTKQMRSQYQNLGYQLQDTVIQLEMGTHWTRVFAQQGSQVLGAFGPWPAILSAAGAAAVVLAQKYGIFGDNVEDVDHKLEELNSAISAYIELAERAEQSTSKFTEEFGQFASQVQEGASNLAELTLADALDVLDEKLKSIDGTMTSFRQDLRGVEALRQQIVQTSQQELDRAENISIILDAIYDKHRLTEKQVRSVVAAMDTYTAASDDVLKQQDAAKAFYDTLLDIYGSADQIPKLFRETAEAMQLSADAGARLEVVSGGVQNNVEGTLKASQDMRVAWDNYNEVWGQIFAEVGKTRTEVAEMNRAAAQFTAAMSALPQALTASLGPMSMLANQGWRWAVAIQSGMGALMRKGSGYRGTGSATYGGGRGGDPRGFEADPYWSSQFFPSPLKYDSSGGGGKSSTEKEIERQRKLQEELDKSIAAAQLFGRTMEEDFGNLASSALDQFIDGLVEGQFAFKDFARSVLQDLAKIMLRAIIVNQLLRMAGIQPGTSAADMTGFQRVISQVAGLSIPNAKGNIISGGNVVPFAHGGVVSSPTLFPMASGTGLMGEAGPEVIAPLRRDGAGNMGVGAVAPVVNIHNYSGQPVDVASGPGGQVDVIVGMARNAVQEDFSRSLSTGQGAYARAIEGGINARRKYG